MDAGFTDAIQTVQQDFPSTTRGSTSQSKPIGGYSKRFCDVSLALSAIIALIPILIVITVLVWQYDRRNPFFGHKRVGHNGRTFRCWKFRSMAPNAGEILAELLRTDAEAAREWSETHKLRKDPRITPIGRLLRLSSLDELPQLVNVLMGHMSIVGPRPIVADEVVRYGAHVAYYMICRPGLTGLWQVSGRSDTSYDERVLFDVAYACSWSLWRDVVIVARTVPVLLNREGSC